MSVYLINIKLMIFFLSLIFFLSSCVKIKVIEDNVEVIRPQVRVNEGKDPLLQSLDGVRAAIESKAEDLVSLAEEIATDKKKLDSIYQTVLAIDFMDESVEVSLEQSKAYYDFFQGAEGLLDKATSNDIPTKMNDVNTLRSDAETEGRKLTDSMNVREVVDKVSANAVLAESEQNKVDNILKEVEEQKKTLHEKIEHVAVGFSALLGEKKSSALDEVIADVDGTASLLDIDKLLRNPKFFSLRTEIKEVKPEGQKFTEYFEGDMPAAKPIVDEEIRRISSEAIRQKSRIDAYFNGGHPVPIAQNEFDTVARALDGLLGGEELTRKAANRGVVKAEDARKTAVLNIIDPPTVPGAPPPLPGAVNNIKPRTMINTISQNIGRIKLTTPAKAQNEIKTAINNQVKSFYEPSKLNAILEAITKAGDANSPRFKPTFDNLTSAFLPYSIDGLKDLLREGGKLNGSLDEREFYKNFLIIMKSNVNADLFTKIRLQVDKAIIARVNFLKKYLTREDPTYKLVEQQFEKLEGITDQALFIAKCNDVKEALKEVLQHPINCPLAKILKKTIKKADQTKPFWDKIIFSTAHNNITEPFYKAFEKLVANAGEKEENVKIKILNKEEQDYLLKGETDLRNAVKKFNEMFLKSPNIIDMDRWPEDHLYNNQILIKLIAKILSTENLAEGKESIVYGIVVDAYWTSLFPSMTAAEITNVFDQIKKSNPVAKLHLVLSPHGYESVTVPFAAPSKETLFANMKDAALGKVADKTAEGAGLVEFLEMFQKFEDAIGEAGTEDAIKNFAKFFNDVAPKNFKTKIENAASVVGIDNSADFSLATGQLGSLKQLVEKDPRYLALNALATIDLTHKPSPQVIIMTKGDSLEERAGPDDSGSTKKAIPPGMRRSIFGADVGGEITVVQQFNALKNYLKKSLEVLKAKALSVGGPKGAVEPLVNAFNLAFLYPLSEMSKLAFDGTNDDQIAKIYLKFDEEYAEKFKRLKSVVGENHSKSAQKREIFKLLDGYTDSSGTAHSGLDQKIAVGTSTSTEAGKVNKYVKQFLQ